jgi:hypothetical protein
VPAAAQGAVELDQRQELVELGLGEGVFSGVKMLRDFQDFEIVLLC